MQFVNMSEKNVSLQRTIIGFFYVLGIYVFLRWLFFPLLPFLLALGLSALLEPQVQRLRRALSVRRSFAAALVTGAVLLVAGGGLALLALKLRQELLTWSQGLPETLERFPALWNSLLDRIEGWYTASPSPIRSALDSIARQINREGLDLVGTAGRGAMEAVSTLAGALPRAGLFLVTTVLAICFTAMSYPAILSFLKRQLPPAWQPKCRRAAQCCRTTMLKWLRAELLLLLTTFLLLFGGFSWIGVDFALLAAFATALVDALPVLGAGTVLLPWAAGCLLLGQRSRALSLAALYGVVLLVHSLLEPRLLAGQAGLPPITALMAMYLGFHFLGVGGMVLLPVLLLLLKQLQDAGVIKIWR